MLQATANGDVPRSLISLIWIMAETVRFLVGVGATHLLVGRTPHNPLAAPAAGGYEMLCIFRIKKE